MTNQVPQIQPKYPIGTEVYCIEGSGAYPRKITIHGYEIRMNPDGVYEIYYVSDKSTFFSPLKVSENDVCDSELPLLQRYYEKKIAETKEHIKYHTATLTRLQEDYIDALSKAERK